jgi:CrcB protein
VGSIPTPGITPIFVSPMPTPPPTFPPLTVLWVALGGALGSALRFGLAEWARRFPVLAGFPWSTLAINVSGSLALGAIAGWLASGGAASPALRAFVMIGILGGYTTFSTFAFEGVKLLDSGQYARVALYAALSVLLSVGAAGGAFVVARG